MWAKPSTDRLCSQITHPRHGSLSHSQCQALTTSMDRANHSLLSSHEHWYTICHPNQQSQFCCGRHQCICLWPTRSSHHRYLAPVHLSHLCQI